MLFREPAGVLFGREQIAEAQFGADSANRWEVARAALGYPDKVAGGAQSGASAQQSMGFRFTDKISEGALVAAVIVAVVILGVLILLIELVVLRQA